MKLGASASVQPHYRHDFSKHEVLGAYFLATHYLKNLYEIARNVPFSLNISSIEVKATQKATIHKNTSLTHHCKLYFIANQIHMFVIAKREFSRAKKPVASLQSAQPIAMLVWSVQQKYQN